MSKPRIMLAGCLVAASLFLPQQPVNDKLVRADFGMTLVLGIVSAVSGKYLYDRYFKDGANHGAAVSSRDLRDRQCAFAFPSYDPGTGLATINGKKRVCPYLLK